ncbi:lipase 3-like [Plodia interpunctella]|uniref:lipase 3-like n=1 Tax=Plodia interpunctella TaxID=58824 RepID=UPI0023687C8B|nr:lipase 3-like [Plodia interpunctella]
MILLFLFVLINYSTATDLDIIIRSSMDTISSSFNKLMEDIKNFFMCKYEALLHRKLITKNAFNKFISETFNKSANKKCQYVSSRSETSKANIGKFNGKTKQFKQNLDIDMTKLITFHGYRLETHTALTPDGYLLTLHRVFLRDSTGREMKKVLLHHGLLGSSEDWVILGSNKALPYLLWLSGYDVWMTNARGNKFSKAHSVLPVDSEEYWDFSFHEIGIYDIAAAINYIRDIGDSTAELHYVGYSMGATALLVLLSTHPEYNNILKTATLLAPLAFMSNVKGTIRYFADVEKYGYIDDLGHKDFLANVSIPNKVFHKFCVHDHRLCLKSILLFANGGEDILNKDLRNDIMTHASEEGSAKTLKHYVQLINSGQFQMYDYGPDKNMKKYGMRSPPSYRLNDVTLPIAIITSIDDWISTIGDITNLLPFFSNLIGHHVVKRYKFSHTDFLWAEDAPQLVYSLVLDILSDPQASRFQNENILRNNLIVN